MGFTVFTTAIREVILICGDLFRDKSGSFRETYRKSAMAGIGLAVDFVQDNVSYSVKGVLRGLHYQKAPKAQAKLVTVLHGEIFDVAVDIRKGSPTYGKWVGVTLRGERNESLYVPEGFAHGFCVLSDHALVSYKVGGSEYAPECERGIAWNDPEIGIDWPVGRPILSERDANLPFLRDADNEFVWGGKV